MIKITKGPEPPEWKLCRETPGASFSGAHKAELRRSLWDEQGHLCAYCMKRIVISDGSHKELTRIEHLKSQSWCKENGREDLLMDYHNLVLCCQGNDNDDASRLSFECCDVHKHDACLSFDIFSDAFEKTLSYDIENGTLASDDPDIHRDINDTLNLNNTYLCRNRLAAFTAWLNYMHSSGSSLEEELRLRSTPSDSCELLPYCGFIIWYLKSLLAIKRS
ncbi:MAG: hypothetical protein J1E42_03820 [Akkermansiaceae bacterium]|nr:hypothetical protein [Akkermansiaceae bacterium]